MPFCHQCGQQLNLSIVTNYDLSQVSNKAASSVNKEKQLKEYFYRGYPYAAFVSLLEIRHGVRMHVRMLKSRLRIDLENSDLFVAVFSQLFNTLITCRSFIVLTFIYARKAIQIKVRKLCKI